MSKLANLYSNEVKKHFKVLYANWEPGGTIELGDYGILSGNIFIPVGNIKKDFPEIGEIIDIKKDDTVDYKEFKSQSGIEVNLNSKGSVNAYGIVLSKATLNVNFSSEDSVFFSAAECQTWRISNKAKLGEKIMQLWQKGKWKKKYCVVTDLVEAGRTIVAISEANNSSISFEVKSPIIEKINLADASIGLERISEKSIGYRVDAEEGLKLLLGLCKIRNIFWPDFKPHSMVLTDSMRYEIENEPSIKTEESDEELYFGQLGL